VSMGPRLADAHALGSARRRPHAQSLVRVLAKVGAALALWRRRSRYRRDLARLRRSGPHLIEDIGLLREHVDREAAKPFWQP
jgi:uncharacterized protein YjiS (DUF1127 family)